MRPVPHASSRVSTATAPSRLVEGKALLARAFQHEMDHLDGVVFVDRLRGIKRDLIVRQNPEAAAQRPMVSTRTGRRLRIVYFGTPEFAVPTLRRLLDLDARLAVHEVVALVSQPDRPKGRGHRLAPTPDQGTGHRQRASRCFSRSD